MSGKNNISIGQILLAEGLVTSDQLDIGLAQQKRSGGFICATLVRLGFADKDKVFSLLAKQLAIPYVNPKTAAIDPAAIEKVPAKIATHYKVMPISLDNAVLTVAMADPVDLKVLDDLSMFLNLTVKSALAYEDDVLEALKKHYGIGAQTLEKMMDKTTFEKEPAGEEIRIDELEARSQEATVTKFVDQLLSEAVKDRATDIHLEPYQDKIRTRFRVDGVLYDANIPATIKYFYPAVVLRIKVMANLNIAERRLPQDGRIKIKADPDELDLRISILPLAFGEAVHIRILSSKLFLDIEKLGLMPQDLKIIEAMIRKPHGIIFITGPTGSGKSTTLYACLSRLNAPGVKIITIEDPIEYQLQGVNQMQVQPKIDFTFATGLRHVLRHDPDIIMVGEVRDFETAEISIRAALTGHLVFSTLHTNDAAGSVTRLVDMGLEPYLVSSSLECLVAQRLVRLICPDCKQSLRAKDITAKLLSDSEMNGLDGRLYEGRGCQNCRNTGFRGRTGIYEILPLSDPVRKLILSRASSQQIRLEAIKAGMRTLRQDGLQKISSGVTTLSEIIRVTSMEETE